MGIVPHNPDLVDGLGSTFIRRDEESLAWGCAVGANLFLPYLRCFWPMSAVDAANDAMDLSRLGLDLADAGGLAYSYDGLAPYVGFNGTTQYLSRADTASLDILGSMTVGGWFYITTASATTTLVSKWTTTANQRSWVLWADDNNVISGYVSGDGATSVAIASSVGVNCGAWFFGALRFTPSTTVDIFVNDTKYSQTVGVPAALFNSSAAFQVGASNAGTNLLAGRASLIFYCAGAVSDEILKALYEVTAGMFLTRNEEG